ncbi:hypothetical protein D3C76_672840 [compost metagenome]
MAALIDLAQQLVVEAGQFGGALAHPLLQVLVGLVQGLGGLAALGNVADQHEDPHHFTVGQAVGDVGAQHVALLIVDVGFGKLERHALPRQRPRHVGFKALVMLLAVGLAQALAEHYAARPAIPLFIDLVGELVDQVSIEVGDQRRHMVGNQPYPALAFAEGFGVLVALGDIGEGVDETAGGQRMRTDFQHAPVVQALFALVDDPPVGVAAVWGQQAQFAVADHLGKGPVGSDWSQAAELQKTPVPQFQNPLGIDHGHPLGQVVHRPLQQVRLLCHGLLAAQGFAELDLGDIGKQDHSPAFAGRPFTDLQPAPVVQPVQQVLVGVPAGFFAEQATGRHQPLDLGQAHAGNDAHPGVGPEGLEAAVAQHDPLVLIEQHEGVRDAFDGVDQVLVGRLGPQSGFAEQMVAGLELGHGLVQGIGAFTHLLGQHYRMLERRVRVVATRHAGLDALDQCAIDPLQLMVFVLQPGDLGLQFSG